MRFLSALILPALLPLIVAVPTAAQAARHRKPDPAAAQAGGPHSIGKFQDWQAAVHDEGGKPACYAFTRATSSTPRVPGRGDVVLTVTQREGGRDAVAISAGFNFPPNAEARLDAGAAKLDFYTAQRSAFARDGHAAVDAFAHAGSATAHMPAPRKMEVKDSFSLRGFGPAYAAINKACPK